MQNNAFHNLQVGSPLPYHHQIYNNPLHFASKLQQNSESDYFLLKNRNKIIQNSNENKFPYENLEKKTENNEENPDNPGNNLLDFKILEELGKGSYGIVYKVRSLINKKEYVIKKIDLKILNAKHRKESLQEVQLLKRLSHPNMIKYYNSFLEKDILFIVMEYAEGGDLQKLIKTKKDKKECFTEQEIWTFAYELLLAINHLHSNSIIHRDIKTLNVFLSKNQQIKLGDLGVSKIVSQAGVFEGTRVGTPLYLAPELVQNRPYDYKIDVWALGCVLYHLTNLEPPFIGENLISLGYNIVNKSPKQLNTIYSSRLANFIMKLLEKNPGKRSKVFDLIREIEGNLRKNNLNSKDEKREKIEVSNEKEYQILTRNILEEKGLKYKKIQERYKKSKEPEEKFNSEQQQDKNQNLAKASDIHPSSKNNNFLMKYESFSQLKSNQIENISPAEIEDKEKKLELEKNDKFSKFEKNNKVDKLDKIDKIEKFDNELSNFDKEEKNYKNEKLLKKEQIDKNDRIEKNSKSPLVMKNNFMSSMKKKENPEEIKKEEIHIQKYQEKEEKIEFLPEGNFRKSDIVINKSKIKKNHNIFELKNPKNINCINFQEKTSQNPKIRPLSANFKPKFRTAENFYPMIKQLKDENIERQENNNILNDIEENEKAENFGYNSKPSAILLRPRSAMLPMTKQRKENLLQEKLEIVKKSKVFDEKKESFEDYSKTKGIKPVLKYDGNYIDNDETKKYRYSGENLKEASVIDSSRRMLIRPQTALLKGEKDQKKKLTIFDLF